MSPQVISIDIGSTYTKGALFTLNDNANQFFSQKIANTPTTIAAPIEGVKTVLQKLSPSQAIPLYFSSSAKGGLSIVAIGIVPELTLQMAKLTAYSAGGKIVKVFSYKLTEDDIAAIDELQPDIVLFAGGTDGGNESYNLHNAEMLKTLQTNPTILYAGNKALKTKIGVILADKNIEFTTNILPSIDSPQPEAAREKIREIFLKRIIECKGLSEIRKLAGHDPYPTPFSVFELVKKIPQYQPDWKSFCLIDMGGATTDFYSHHHEEFESGIVYKGLKEPDTKRTVEGDLGMRVSAQATFTSGKAYLEKLYSPNQLIAWQNYVNKASHSPEYLPTEPREIEFDNVLAKICISLAAIRHTGTRKRIYTATGETFLQQGKDLSTVKKIIGSGGFLAKFTNLTVTPEIFKLFAPSNRDETSLLPTIATYYTDENYLIPLLANLATEFPEASVRSVINSLKLIGEQ